MPDRSVADNGMPTGRMRRDRLDRRRSTAKTGMTLSLGALVVTGMMKSPGARTLHLWAGAALVGFSVWHHSLYRPSGRGGRS